MIRSVAATVLATCLVATAAEAAVERIDVLERTALAGGAAFGQAGAYEKIRGRALVALDPYDKANAAIHDLDLAPRDADGKVRFFTDVLMLRPVAPGQSPGAGAVIYDVNNRGSLAIMGQVNGKSPPNNDPTTLEDLGPAHLLKRGYTLLWSAWTWDVEPPAAGNKTLILKAPAATQNGKAITGKVAYEFLVDAPALTARFTGNLAKIHPPADGFGEATLTWRDGPTAKRHVIDRKTWRIVEPVAGELASNVELDGGFQTGKLYELTYLAKDPVITGVGMAGIRDLLSYVKTTPFAGQKPYDRSLIFGISQSGRVINTMLYLGMNRDEQGRPAFDGAFSHVPGAGRGSFNHRFAMPTRHFSPLVEHDHPTDAFPFTSAPSVDPATGKSGSMLDGARAAGALPKVFFVNTSAEYWNRSASLLHTTPDGKADAVEDPNARVYLLAGSQHFVGRNRERAPLTACVNTANHYPVERALMYALDEWVRTGKEPPASRYPSIAKGELVSTAAYKAAFPTGTGLTLPREPLTPPRLDLGSRFESDGIVDKLPPRHLAPYTTLVPRPDADGNDVAGVRQAELEVPLGTHTGWNLRAPKTGFGWSQGRFDGSFVPFARTKAERVAAKDSRRSIEERYADRSTFIAATRAALQRQVTEGFLAADELEARLAERAGMYDRVLAHDPADTSCGYIFPN
ncbi:alpha/beta hydrolase domain-containing protein [Caulobacter sp. 73W]|uniref:Alpha/beta hydrolase domain-containing protein n=1 Tax=Caulobacter sp. 73W TaxID=3161137 RepID=A0AB39KU79_9CAUL